MRIAEIYQSNQGEGLLTGTPSVFVRTSGCNLRCTFCDTPFTSWNPEGENLSLDVIEQTIHSVADGASHVVITGGEPMLPADITPLCERLYQQRFHITIETAGTIDRQLHCDLISISPKLSNSDPSQEQSGSWQTRHRQTRHQPEIVARLIKRHPYQLKFVVKIPEDLNEILQYLDEVNQSLPGTELSPNRILLMPEGIRQAELESREAWLAPLCLEHGFQLCRRMHILWYGNTRGT